MGIGDDVMGEGFKSLPPAARHALSLAVVVAFIVGGYFIFVANPLEAATAVNNDQDKKIAANSNNIEKLTDLVTELARIQAQTGANIANLQENQSRYESRQQRIEDKIDRVLQHQH